MLKSEFCNLVKECFKDCDHSWREIDVSLQGHNPESGELCIVLSRMYEYVDIKFSQLERLAEVTQTKDINIGEKQGHGGCDTCDYGSSYDIPLYLKGFKIPLEEDPPKKRR